MLDISQARAEIRLKRDQRPAWVPPARTVSIVPEGLSVWACSERGGQLAFGSLAIEREAIFERLEKVVACDVLCEPRLNFVNERLWQVGATLAREFVQPDVLSSLACDSLVLLLLIELFRGEMGDPPSSGGVRLSPAQLRRVLEHIEGHLAERITLAELAALAGTSQSHFCHAFKATTGLPPHRWQMEARVRHAQTLLSGDHHSLADVAAASGFADQSHFTRVFRRLAGETPGNWRRNRSSP